MRRSISISRLLKGKIRVIQSMVIDLEHLILQEKRRIYLKMIRNRTKSGLIWKHKYAHLTMIIETLAEKASHFFVSGMPGL